MSQVPEVLSFSSDGGLNSVLPWVAMNNSGGLGGNFLGGGFGGSLIGGFLGALFPNLFGGNRWGNNSGGGSSDAAAAAALGAQATANNNADLIISAVTAQGEQQRQAIQTLSTMLGQDFNIVNSNVQSLQTVLATVAANQGMNVMQVINAIQAGNASIASQLCQCCCENRLLTTEQGYQAQIRTIEQTNQLGSQADRNTASIVGAITALQANMTKEFCDVKEREMQAKINQQAETITQLRGKIDNANQTAQINAYVGSLIAPLQQQVNAIMAKMPNTVPVQYPQLSVVNTTPNYGYGGNFNGFF